MQVAQIYLTFSKSLLEPLLENEEPMREYLVKLGAYVNQENDSVHSNLSLGDICYLIVTIPPAIYSLQTSIAMVTPVNPRVTATISASAADPQIAKIHCDFNQKKIWKEWVAVGHAAKQVIYKHIPEKHYQPLKHKYTGLATVTYLTIYKHLLDE